jgi:phosphohistidine swiveling domain-containing protein
VIPDPEATWTYDRSHYPEPLTPMTASLWFEAMGLGIQAACRELRAPFGGFTTATVDGWAYESELEPEWTPDPEGFRAACLGIAGRWRDELLPEVERGTAEVRAMRPTRSPAPEAVALLDRLVAIVHRQWHIHFLAVLGVHVAREVLAERYAELLGGDALEPYRLLEGLPNATLDADAELAELAGLARRLDVGDAILELPAAVALAELERTFDGREWLRALDGHLARFGARSRFHELAEPRYAERPEFVVEAVRLLLERPPAADERARRAAERDRLEAEVLRRVPAPARTGFAELLGQVKAAAPLEEGHTLHIDQRGLQAVREALVGFGARLVAQGRLDAAEDVFLLDRKELRGAVARDHGRGLQGRVRRRRRELDAAAGRPPALVLGRPPDPDAAPDPMFVKFYGIPGDERGDGAHHLVGYGASPGRASGTARVVRGAADLDRLGPGDVLVCTTTTPSWTPVFGGLAGIVTDTGGILCHAAVIAREYGLPAVVGAGSATARIADGSRVTLDGATGDVWIG